VDARRRRVKGEAFTVSERPAPVDVRRGIFVTLVLVHADDKPMNFFPQIPCKIPPR
jgi:hypothetical protein